GLTIRLPELSQKTGQRRAARTKLTYRLTSHRFAQLATSQSCQPTYHGRTSRSTQSLLCPSDAPHSDSSGRRHAFVPRHLIPALLLVLVGSSSSLGQDWARKMFSESSHDFGTVARGAKVEHRFQFNNPYQETAHVAGVRSSCGC